MSWLVGDLALCIGVPDFDPDAALGDWEPRPGAIYTVSGVYGWFWGDGVVLDFAEDPTPCDEAAWCALSFRKITPGTDIEGVEVERRIKQPVSA